MTAVLVCDDRDRTRRGLGEVLSRVDGIDRVDCLCTARLLLHYGRHPVDVVLVGTPRGARAGIAAVRLLVERHPQADVMVFGSPHDAPTIAAGARGFLRWDTYCGETPTQADHPPSPEVWSVPAQVRTSRPSLSEREVQILTGMSQGRSNPEIRHDLLLAEDSMKSHASQMFHKLEATDRAGAVAQGFRHKLLQ